MTLRFFKEGSLFTTTASIALSLSVFAGPFPLKAAQEEGAAAGHVVVKAAEAQDKDNAEALYQEGRRYYKEGYPGDDNLRRAFRLYQQAAAAGSVEAHRNLAWCYYCGEGVEQDKNHAIDLFQEAMHRGDAWGFTALGEHYKRLGDGERALPLLQQGIDRGDVEALVEMGRCYYRDDLYGVRQDRGRAIQLFQDALEKGSESALPLLYGHYLSARRRDKAEEVVRQGVNWGNKAALDYVRILSDQST